MAEYQLSYTGSQINARLAKIDNLAEKTDIPTKVSELTNDSGFLTSAPVTSVNGKTGAITLSASDVGADANGAASSAVSAHNSSTSAHTDIREQINQLSSEIEDMKNNNDATSYTNVLPLALAADGTSVYNGIGYKENTRWSSSGNEEITASGVYLTGWIPVTVGDIIYLKNITMPNADGNSCLIHEFNNSFTTAYQNDNCYFIRGNMKGIWDDSENLIQFTIPSTNTNITHIRIQCGGISENSIITINEEIPADEIEVKIAAHNTDELAHEDIREQITQNILSIDELNTKVDNLTENTSFTNVLLTAKNADDQTQILQGEDGSIGYLNNTRRSNSSNTYVSSAEWDVTGLMAGQNGNTIYLRNVTIQHFISGNSNHGGIAFYDSTGTYISAWPLAVDSEEDITSVSSNFNETYDEQNNITSFTLPTSWGIDIYYFTITCQDLNPLSIITVNKPITETEDVKIAEIEASISELDERVDTLEYNLSNNTTIPSYWQTHLEERVEDIRRALEEAGRNKSTFFFYSDSHWSNEDTYTAKLAPALLKYLYKKTSINQTNFGGDIVSAESADTDIMKYLWDWREQLRDLPNHHSVIGNHDDGNSTDRLLSNDYIYAYLFAPEESNDIVWGNDFYYYIDNVAERTRYLYLDIFYDGISTEQQNFVKEALKITPSNWHIISISHAQFDNDYSVYPPLLSGLATAMEPMFTMFDNYNARVGDFTEATGKVELCIGGHYHLDHYDFTPGGIPVIIVEADTLHNRSGSWPKKGTTDEATVSAIICDYNNKQIKVIRIGRGNSYTVDMNGGGSVTTYSITNNLTNCTNSNSATSIASGESYSATIYSDDGYSLNTVTVTMGGVDITSSVFIDDSINISAVTGNIVITAIAESESTSYTNVMLSSIASDGTPFADGKGWMANSRVGSGGIYAGNQTPGTDAAQWVTGYIPIEGFGTKAFNIYLKNVVFDSTSTNGNHGVFFFNESFAKISPKSTGSPTHFTVDGLNNYWGDIDENGNFCEISFNPNNSADNTAVKYFCICCGGLSDESIITIDEPINEAYTNLIDTVGYEDNIRLSSSTGENRDGTGNVTTGFIEIGVTGDVYRTSGVDFTYTASGNNIICFYDSSKNFTTHSAYFGAANSTGSGQGCDWTIDANGNLTLTLNENARTGDFFRITGYGSGANLIITKNQEIK